MYTTVASLHVALDTRLQVLNSNRKQTIHPEQYDMAINDAIIQILKDKLRGSQNRVKPGLEESVGRYVELDSLKRRKPLLVYNDGENILTNDNYKFDFPKDCYRPISITCNTLFNKFGLVYLEDSVMIKNIKTITLTAGAISSGTITVSVINPTKEIIINFQSVTKSSKSLNYALFVIQNALRNNGIDCKIVESKIECVSYDSMFQVSNVTNSIVTTKDIQMRIVNIKEFEGDKPLYVLYRNSTLDLVSTESFDNIQSNSLLMKNVHSNLVYKIINGSGYIIGSPKFKVNNLMLEYIKEPIYVNSTLNIMTDVTITDEILDIATTNLSAIIKTGTYETNKIKEQLNT